MVNNEQEVSDYLNKVEERIESNMRVYSHTTLRIKDASATLAMVSRHVVGWVFAITGIDLLIIGAIAVDPISLGVGLGFLLIGVWKISRSGDEYHRDIQSNGEKHGLIYTKSTPAPQGA